MDITAQQLRDVHPPEALRGYQRDAVDALLARAAVRIEELERENRSLRMRPKGPLITSDGKTVDADMIQRALIRAQKTADEAVAEAKAHAERLERESEARAKALVEQAEAGARRIVEEARGPLEADIEMLAAKRDALTQDVEVLEGFASEYRAHIQRAIDAEVERLHTSAISVDPPGERPTLETVDQLG